MFSIPKEYSPADQSLGAAISHENVLWFSDPLPNRFYAWMSFWCSFAVSAMLGLVGMLSEPRVKASIDGMEARWKRAARRGRSGDV